MSRDEGHEEWREEALCIGFADRVDDPFYTDEADWNSRSDRNPGQAWALSMCRHCPVKRQCLDYALEVEGRQGATRQQFGIFGGTTPRQRKAIRQFNDERKAAS